MVHLRKLIFLVKIYNKLKMKKFGPCKIMKTCDLRNDYKVEFPNELNFFLVCKILDLKDYHEGVIEDDVIE